MNHLYLHVPFCNSICYYCDFKRSVYDEKSVDAWLTRMQEELNTQVKENTMETIYLGGGTPTSLNLRQLDQLLSMLDHFCDVQEYTIESNIESLDEAKVKLLLQHGVNRISLGVQSLQDDLLVMMNRKHTSDDVFRMLENIYQWGIHNISCDFIYGFKEQSLAMWESDLHTICQNPYVSHLSLYSLTIEENSVFGKRKQENCDSEMEAMMYESAISILTSYGYTHYEVANFAKEGMQSKHNLGYWHYDDFYGIGVGASGKLNNVRYQIEGSVSDYIQHKEVRNEEVLTLEDLMFENIMMSLRLQDGFSITAFNERYHCDVLSTYQEAIDKNIQRKYLVIEDGYIKTTPQGMECLHDVLVDFM